MSDAGVWQVPSQENQDAMDEADGLVVIWKGARHRKGRCFSDEAIILPDGRVVFFAATQTWHGTDQHRRVIAWKCSGCGIVWEEPWPCDAPRTS